MVMLGVGSAVLAAGAVAWLYLRRRGDQQRVLSEPWTWTPDIPAPELVGCFPEGSKSVKAADWRRDSEVDTRKCHQIANSYKSRGIRYFGVAPGRCRLWKEPKAGQTPGYAADGGAIPTADVERVCHSDKESMGTSTMNVVFRLK